MKVAVIGSGPAGLTAAYVLSKHGVRADVYEASNSVGGLAKSFQLWGQRVDVGPHRFFSSDRRVNELWLEVVGRDYAMINRLTRILYQQIFYRYPLQPWEALRNLGPLQAIQCIGSYLRECALPVEQEGTFETWVRSRFGKRLYEIFFKTYSEKLWGIPCDELDADFAAQRIKQFSLSAAIINALGLSRSNSHKTLVDQFAYPLKGTGMVYQRMAEKIEERGGHVLLSSPVQSVLRNGNRVAGITLEDGACKYYDHVISSMPLTLLVMCLPEVPEPLVEACRRLKYRNTILVYLEVTDSDICKDNWIYIHSPEVKVGRVTNFRNWVPDLYGESPNTILALEYWCNDDDPMWKDSKENLIALAKNEIVATGLVADVSKIINGMPYRIPRCYPVYQKGYKELLKPVQEFLRKIDGLQVIGRYGSFKYNNQDHSILMGLLAAENIIDDADHDLWSVNADYDSYQESSRITETGLVQDARP